jgi:hypothetical protein
MSKTSYQSKIALPLLSLIAAVALALPAAAVEWVVPAASHAPGGANTNWRTDLRIVNPSGSTASVRIDLLPSGADNSARSRNVTLSVAAHGQLSLVDVVDSRFSYAGNAALLVTSSESSLVVTSRTYNQAPGGATYGQYIPGVLTTNALTPGTQGNLIYLTKNADYRTNVGYAGTTEGSGTVTITVFDASGVQLGTNSFPVQPYGQFQVNDVFGQTGSASADVARAVVTATVPIVAYASIIDNRTGDPIALLAARDSEAASLFAVPGIGHLNGAADSVWRSDVRVYHPGQGTVPLILTYYPGNTANPTPVQRTVSIGPRQVMAFNDMLLTTFGIDNGNGGLRVQSDSPLMVTSRTYNLVGSATFGQDIPAVAYSNALPANATAIFSGLSDSGYRSNVGFFNLGDTAIDLTLALKGGDGATLASKAFRLEAHMMTQTNIFSYVGVSGTTSASLAVTGSGSGSYVAYASVIDSASGDPVFIPAVRSTATASTGGDCVTLPYMRAGMILDYRTSDNKYTSTQTVISDSATKTELHDEAVAGGQASKIDSSFDYVTQGDLRAVTHMLSKASVSVSGFSITTNTDITFSPALVISPATTYCAGATFAIPATTQTVTLSGTVGGGSTVTQRPAATGVIQAVNESLTTAGGTFSTVKYKSTQGATSSGVAYSIGWYDIATAALVRQIEYDSNDNAVQTLDLVGLH